MKGFSSVPSAFGVVLAVVASAAMTDAEAALLLRKLSANAASYCQAALPVFDGQIRKRPLAVQNEGATNAFITCSFTHHVNAGDAIVILMMAQNNGGSAQDLTCTLVTGFATGLNEYVPKTVTLPPGGERQGMAWFPTEFTGNDAYYSLSCNLLPGVGLNDSYVHFYEDVGA